MKRKLFSFADSRLSAALERVRAQALALNFFDEISVLTEDALDPDFKKRWAHVMIPGTRGFGYWVWKPVIILQELMKMDEGDHLYYIDAGCHLNPRGIKRLKEYDEMCTKSVCGIVATVIAYTEKSYTKADLFDYMGVIDNEDITNTHQVQSGVIFIRKCRQSIELLQQWGAVWEHDLHLIDDSPSKLPNDASFVEHRHDQSVFSILCKLNKATLIDAEEVEPPVDQPRNIENWKKMKHLPILAMRDRPIPAKLKRKIRKFRFYASLRLGSFSQKYQDKLTKLYQTTPCLMDPLPYLQD